MNDLRTEGSPKATEEMWSLANGPGSIIDLYSGCICNGVRFHTRDRENRLMCQNSGIVVEGEHNGKQIYFYGYLQKIWELRYLHGGTVVLFQCEWYKTSHKSRIYTDAHITSIDVTRLWCKDDPFVLPSQVKQVFYVNDIAKGKNWKVVEQVRHRGVWDVPERDDTSNDAFQQDETTDDIPILVEDGDIHYNRDDMNPEIILQEELMSNNIDDKDEEDETMADYIDDEEDEQHRQPDLDVDSDMDYDI